jgi:hypothetical protein
MNLDLESVLESGGAGEICHTFRPNIKEIGVLARHAACVAIGKGEGESRGDSFGQ